MSEKPEWFQITEGDEKPEVKKSKKGFLKIAAVALPLVVVGAVAVGANGEEDDAPQFSPTITSNTSTSNATAPTSATTISKSSVNSPKISTISNPSTTSPAAPAIPWSGFAAAGSISPVPLFHSAPCAGRAAACATWW